MSAQGSNLPAKILVVDNDQTILRTISNICQKYKINAVTAQTYENALYYFNQSAFDIAIVQINLEGMLGPTLLQKWRHHEIESKRTCAFILSIGTPAKGDDQHLATEIGDTSWLYKPISEPKLISMLAKVMIAKKQRDQIEGIREKVLNPMIRKKDLERVKALTRSHLEPMGVRGRELAGEVLEQIEAFPEALDQFENLHAGTPLNMRYLNEIGQLSLKLGKLDKAQIAFEQADKVAPRNLSRIKQMATMYLKLGRPDDSVEKFKQVLSLDPSDPEQKYGFFEELQSFGYAQHAQDLCAATTDPLELIRYFNNKGVMYSKSENYLDAIDAYKKAQKLIPGSKYLHRILYNEAIANFNLKTEESLHRATELLKECLRQNSKFDKAKEKLEMLEQLHKKTG